MHPRSHRILLLGICLAALSLQAACVTWNKGLGPVQPGYWPLRNSTTVDSLRPVFEWKPYESKLAGVEQLQYELHVVWKTSTVYRVVTPETVHAMTRSLLPGQKYTWYVRPVFQVNGQRLAGDWNRQGYFYITPLVFFFGWGERFYQFKTPN